MIYLQYVLSAAIVVFFSIKASDYIDLLDRNTKLSGAFLGGIMLSAVTSLPELFTSISATVLLDQPGLCMGNILGSDLFNVAALSAAILFWFKGFSKGRVSKSYRHVTILVLVIYGLICLNFLGILNLRILNLSVTSVLIFVVYVLGAKYLAVASDVDADEDTLGYQATKSSSLSVKQIGFRFFIVSIGIIVFSIVMTYQTDLIAERLGIGQGFAGALFLGVATSLPELSSTIALFKMKNYNVAVGNIVGSNLFNFIILTVADLLSMSSGVYAEPDAQVVNLLGLGAAAMAFFWILLRFRSRVTQAVCSLAILACYVAFLLL